MSAYWPWIALAAAVAFWLRSLRRRRGKSAPGFNRAFLVNYRFPSSVPAQVRKEYPDLARDQVEEVLGGLRDYFHLCGMARLKHVSMPSKAVDTAWHQFILDTREYGAFCKTVYGRFLHHFPAESMRTPTIADDGIKRAWQLACALEGIDRKTPHKLPRLFALDSMLAIPGGFAYALDCAGPVKDGAMRTDSGPVYCATHIGCSSCSAGFGGYDTPGPGHYQDSHSSSSWNDQSHDGHHAGHHDTDTAGSSSSGDSGGGGDSGCGGGGD